MPPSPSSRLRLALASLAAAAVLLGSSAPGLGYALEGQSWPGGRIVMQLQIAPASHALSDGRASLNDSAADDLNTWNPFLERVQFVATTAPAGFTPTQGDGVNSVFSTGTVYGDAFGSGVLAVTLLGYERSSLIETDVLINSQYDFDSYNGPLQRPGGTTKEDLHRVLLHEFGHVLGLAHPDQAGQNVTAIMNSHISDLDHLAADDIAGVHYLYDTVVPSSNSTATFARIQADKLQISEMVSSPATGNIYAIGSKNGTGASRLTVFNPYTLAVADSPAFAQPPAHLAISDDGRFLYVAYPATPAASQRVSRLDLFTDQVDEDFSVVLPSTATVDHSATVPQTISLQVAPGRPDTLAILESYHPSSLIDIGNTAAVVYDHGQPLANFESFREMSTPQLRFAGDPAHLVLSPTGLDSYLYRLTADSTGIISQSLSLEGDSDLGTVLLYNGGTLYNGAGEAVDPATGSVLAQIVPAPVVAFSAAIDPGTNRIFYVASDSAAISAYSLPDGTNLGSVVLPNATQGHFPGSNLITWGKQGLAFSSPTLRGLFVASSVTFAGDPSAGGTPDVLTLQGPANGSIAQNSGQALKFRVRRASSLGDSSGALTVHYTVTGTGVNGVNFRPLTGSIDVPARSSQVKLKLVPLPGSLTDGPVTVNIALAADPAYVIAAPAAAAAAITP